MDVEIIERLLGGQIRAWLGPGMNDDFGVGIGDYATKVL
jgi:hypothetical protein